MFTRRNFLKLGVVSSFLGFGKKVKAKNNPKLKNVKLKITVDNMPEAKDLAEFINCTITGIEWKRIVEEKSTRLKHPSKGAIVWTGNSVAYELTLNGVTLERLDK